METTTWTAAEAKRRFSAMLDASGKEPQVILRHGKPVGVFVDWDLFNSKGSALKPGIDMYLRELAEINRREGDFETPARADRIDIGAGLF